LKQVIAGKLPMNDKNESIPITCEHCKDEYVIVVKAKDKKAWDEGEYIQDAFPYLTAGQRELLISQTCDDCFDKMFPNS
jgi:hypothetical protein